MENVVSQSDFTSRIKTQPFFPLQTEADLDPLLERIGDSKYVLLGEASHGTHEYYTWRAAITKRLIEEKGFSFIAVEGDWPDCFKINRWIKALPDSGNTINKVLHQFKRWPTWMWANWEIAALCEWLKTYNAPLSPEKKIGFYGLDVYSLWESLETLVNYLEKEDPQTAKAAKEVAECFEPYKANDSYVNAYRGLRQNCKDEVLQLLREVRQNMPKYNDEREGALNAELNALVMKNADTYYEAMAAFDNSSWNVRDSHMVETLNTLMHFHGKETKAIIWEHNTHIGDARYTDMAAEGMHNVGQLVRQQHHKDGVVLVGFGSYQGTVMAGEFWGAPMKRMALPPAKDGSVEYKLRRLSAEDKLLVFGENAPIPEISNQEIGHRAVGVVYNPSREWGNYVPSILNRRYDAFLYIDQTTALHPLHLQPNGHLMPETYPFGI